MLGGVGAGLNAGNKAKGAGVRSKPADVLDTYVKAQIGATKRRTKTVDDAGTDPVFDSSHDNRLRLAVKVRVGEEDVEPELTLAVWDDDPGRDDFLGKATIPLWGLVDVVAYRNKMMSEADAAASRAQKMYLAKAEEQMAAYLQEKGGCLMQKYAGYEKRSVRRGSAPDAALPLAFAVHTGAGHLEAGHAAGAGPKEAEAIAPESTTAVPGGEGSVSPAHEVEPGMTKRLLLRDHGGDLHKGWLEVVLEWEPLPGVSTHSNAVSASRPRGNDPLPGAPPPGAAAPAPPMGVSTRPRRRSSSSSDEDDEMTIGHVIVTIVRGHGLEATEDADDQEDADMLFAMSVITLLVYVVTGVLFFVFMGEKDDPDGATDGSGNPARVSWTVIDAIYFTVITFTTVGYGDLLPHDAGTRMFTAVYALIGVSLIGFALGIVTSYIMEMVESTMKEQLAKAKSQDPGVSSAEAQKRVSEARIHAKKLSVRWKSLTMLLTIAVGAGLFRFFEPDGGGEDWWTAIYCAVITSSSVGYGDFSFSTQGGRVVGMFYALIAVMVCARVIGSIADLVVDIQSSKVYEAKLRKTIKANDILRMDEDDDGEVDKLEFLKIYLTRLGKVDKADIDEIMEQFDVLDVDGSGTLTFADLVPTQASPVALEGP